MGASNRCRTCLYWAFLDTNTGQCTAHNHGGDREFLITLRAEKQEDGNGPWKEIEDPNYGGVMYTDPDFGCTQYENRQHD